MSQKPRNSRNSLKPRISRKPRNSVERNTQKNTQFTQNAKTAHFAQTTQ